MDLTTMSISLTAPAERAAFEAQMKMILLRHTKRAFTLIEILVALIILTAGVVAIAGLFATSLVGSIDAEDLTIAMNLAQRRMEEIRNLDFDTEIVDAPKAAVAGFSGFQREVAVEEPETDLKQVTVTVYWTYKGDELNAPLSTYISKN